MTVALVVSLLILVYTYIGYPALIWVLSRVRPRPVAAKRDYLPSVSICIPVFNAASYVEGKLASLAALDYPADKLEFIVYSDGSTDATLATLRELGRREPRLVVIEAERRQGKPTALNVMSERAGGEVLVLTDIRQPLDRQTVRELVAPLGDPTVGAVSGNLVLVGATGAGAYWRYENAIRHAEGRFRGMVGVTGPIYALRRADFEPVPEDTILDDMWVPLKQCLTGRRVVFAPRATAYDEAFADEREFSRKARTLAGNYQLFSRLPALLVPFRSGLWFEVMSHKVLRLVCPWALLLCLAASSAAAWQGAEAHAAWTWAVELVLGGQVVFYLLALAGERAGGLGKIARTFVVLNAAALVGLWRFFGGRQKVTW